MKPLAKNDTHDGDRDFCRRMVELFNGVLAFEAKKMRGLNPTATRFKPVKLLISTIPL